jgi:hypothetical protein
MVSYCLSLFLQYKLFSTTQEKAVAPVGASGMILRHLFQCRVIQLELVLHFSS